VLERGTDHGRAVDADVAEERGDVGDVGVGIGWQRRVPAATQIDPHYAMSSPRVRQLRVAYPAVGDPCVDEEHGRAGSGDVVADQQHGNVPFLVRAGRTIRLRSERLGGIWFRTTVVMRWF